jgi:ATP-dependent DNA helicase RecQ
MYTGAFRNLIVAPEQFFPEGGHIPRLALMLKDHNFIKRIGFFFIDEAHFIVTAGEPKPGEKLAFRTAYGKLAEVLLQLPVDVLVALFSATLPQEMLQRIIKSLNLPRDLTDTFMLTTKGPWPSSEAHEGFLGPQGLFHLCRGSKD